MGSARMQPLALSRGDLAELRRVHVRRARDWGNSAGTDFWIMGGAHGDLAGTSVEQLGDAGWTFTSITELAGAGADFISTSDKGTPGHFVINAASDLATSPAIFGDYLHAHQAATLMGEKNLPRYLIVDAFASFDTASSGEVTSNIGFVEDGGSPIVAAEIIGSIYSNGTVWGVQANASVAVGTVTVDTFYHWFRVVLDKVTGLVYGYVDGTFINSVAFAADEFPAKFGWGTGTNNDIELAQAHVYYAWRMPAQPSKII